MNTLQKLKQGKKNYKLVDFPGTTEKVAIAILTSDEIQEARLKAEEHIKKFEINDDDYKEVEHQKQIVYRALRDKDEISKRLASSFEELTSTLDTQEIQYLFVEYTFLTSETSPFLNAIDDETFETLKKTLEKIKLKDLNGQSLLALRNFLLTLA